jgi:hypothetical protein
MLYTGVKAVGKGKKPKKPVVEESSEDEAPAPSVPVKEKKTRAPMSDEQKGKLKAGRDAKAAAKAAGFATTAEHKAHLEESSAAEEAKSAKKAAAKAKRDAKKAETLSPVQESTPSATSVSGSEGKVIKRKPKAKKVSVEPPVSDGDAVLAEEPVPKKRKFTEPKKFKTQRTKAIKIADRVEQEVTKQMKSRIFPDRVF